MRGMSWRWAWLMGWILAAGSAGAADFRLEKRFELAAGGTLALTTEIGDVVVRGGDGAEAVVLITSERPDFAEVFAVRLTQERPDRLEVVVERKERGLFHWSSGSRSSTRVTVELPRSAAAVLASSGGGVELEQLAGPVQVTSSGGAIRVVDLGGSATLSSSGGQVVAERVRGAVVAESSGGSVEVSDLGGSARLESSGGAIAAERVGGDIEASSSGGGVRIREAGGEVVASSSGGPVDVGFAAGNSRGGSLESSGGGVVVRLDPAARLDIDASSSGGGVSTDLPVTVQGRMARDLLRGKLNGGGALLKLRSSGGGITLAPR